ncbi:hypothetical protein M433DRAFT_257954 [Acidomyces richmondensis BFW]|nr:hypothetical protein M433DRAFT_257954 [Acidomyces richmondensis BFW]
MNGPSVHGPSENSTRTMPNCTNLRSHDHHFGFSGFCLRINPRIHQIICRRPLDYDMVLIQCNSFLS